MQAVANRYPLHDKSLRQLRRLVRHVQCLRPKLDLLPNISEPCGSTGFQEICPVSGTLASKTDALTGIDRADTANEIQFRSLYVLQSEITIQRFNSSRG